VVHRHGGTDQTGDSLAHAAREAGDFGPVYWKSRIPQYLSRAHERQKIGMAPCFSNIYLLAAKPMQSENVSYIYSVYVTWEGAKYPCYKISMD
jgi:hypothetical protein